MHRSPFLSWPQARGLRKLEAVTSPESSSQEWAWLQQQPWEVPDVGSALWHAGWAVAVSDTLYVGRMVLGREGGSCGNPENHFITAGSCMGSVRRGQRRRCLAKSEQQGQKPGLWLGQERRSQAPAVRMGRGLGEKEKEPPRMVTCIQEAEWQLLHPLKGKKRGPGDEENDVPGGEILLGSDRPRTTFQSRLLLASWLQRIPLTALSMEKRRSTPSSPVQRFLRGWSETIYA